MREVEMHDDSNLRELREITMEITDPPVARPSGKNVYTFQDDENGTVLAWPLFDEEDRISVLRVFVSKGTEYPAHSHEQWESVMVYRGQMVCRREDHEHLHTPAENPVCILRPGEHHSFYFPERAWLIASTIPKAEEWPDARKR